jgi:hypothetical protein
MGDLWNPFDANNPVYASLAKEMGATRRRVRTGTLLVIVASIVAAQSYRQFGGPVNQFGVISRK